MSKTAKNILSRPKMLVSGVVILTAACLAVGRFAQADDDDKTVERPSKNPPAHLVVDRAPVKTDGRLTTSFAPVVKKLAPCVVNVFTTTKSKNVSMPSSPFFNDPMFRRFFGEEGSPGARQGRTPRQSGLGSGVVVTKDGYILTNNHVVENADEVRVGFTDGRDFTAKVVGRDPKTDIAVLKVEADDLDFASLADSETLQVGDVVLAIGNPFGVGQTVTMGIVSATGRATLGLDYEDFIQTDAAINPGNSGGALVDAEGRLIGINTAILSRSGGNQGIGFAVPVNLASGVMQSLIRDGRVVRGFMGVNIQDLTPALAGEFGIKETAGALVAEVTPKGPAEKAGLKTGDVILEFNGKTVRDSRHLKLHVAGVAPGTRVPVRILRDGKTKNLELLLKEFPNDQLAKNDSDGEAPTHDALDGVTVGDIDSNSRRQLSLPANVQGALVSQVEEESAAYSAGLRPGDILLEINRQKVADASQAVELSEKIKDGKTLLRIWSRGSTRFLVVEENKVG